MPHFKYSGFTLAETMIALLILAIINIYTIPKIISNGNNSQKLSIAKEMIGTMSDAYTRLKFAKGITPNTTLNDLTPYLNYVKISTLTTVSIDDHNTNTNSDCSNWHCYFFANGSAIAFRPTTFFNGTSTTNSLPFLIDPDGKYSGLTSGAGKAVQLRLYYNGRILDRENLLPGSCDDGACDGPWAGATPVWFKW